MGQADACEEAGLTFVLAHALYLKAIHSGKQNSFKANAVIAIKLARAVYFMLKHKTVFDAERLTMALAH